MNSRSLRFRLTAWHAAVLAAVFVLLSALLFSQLKSYLEATLIETQARRARQIGETLIAGIPRTGEGAVGIAVESLYTPESSDRFIRISRRDRSVVYVSGPPNDLSFDPATIDPAEPETRPEFARKAPLPGGGTLLIAAFRVDLPGTSYLVEVGTSAEPVGTLLHRLAILLGIGLPIVVLVAGGGGYVLVRRALRPVEQIAGKAEIITQHNLAERLPVSATGDELEHLSESLNRMITRLDDAFQNSKRFVADASHELRTPLTILRGEMENLAQDGRVPADLHDRLGSLLEEVERLSKIVERLFALSRLDAGEAQAECVRFDLRELTAGVADQMSLLADDKDLSVTCDPGPAVYVEGDRARLKQVVVNLLDNAIKYTAGGGAIRLNVSATGRHAILEVSDTGAGVPAEALPYIFDRFFRADQSHSSQPEGAGLGLAIVKSICNAHGGAVGVESAPGRGSTFRVELPLSRDKDPQDLT
jgi:heavy metal sensor kinase